MDRPTDRPTNGRTNIVSYRGATSRLKTYFFLFLFLLHCVLKFVNFSIKRMLDKFGISLKSISVWRGLSKRVEDNCRLPALWASHPRNSRKAALRVTGLQVVEE
jgi:hypothetical protein